MTNSEAIDLLDNLLGMVEDNHDSDYDMALRMAIDALKQPERITGRAVYQAGYADGYNSAQPERKTGKWEIYVISMIDGEGCRCSECGFEGAPYWDFCPSCGCKMEGERDGI